MKIRTPMQVVTEVVPYVEHKQTFIDCICIDRREIAEALEEIAEYNYPREQLLDLINQLKGEQTNG